MSEQQINYEEKIKKIKKIIDNDGLDYWDDTSIMCNKISDIIYENESEELE